jgi:hypothetical protein
MWRRSRSRGPRVLGCNRIFSGLSVFRVAFQMIAGLAYATGSIALAQTSMNDRAVFDIPSQPLMSALEQYGASAGRELLYDAKLAPGRISTKLQGDFSRTQALQILLSGTGLVASFATDNAIVIVPAQQPRSYPTEASVPALAYRKQSIFGSYYGVLQNRIKETFCAKTVLQPGQYRIAVQVWVEGGGHIARIGLLGSSGDLARDDAITATLRGMDVGIAPPAGLEQPFTLVIRPQAPQQAC